ncbi:MAG: hypothetical protein EZS28_032434 [Streblomastix strix]|uniref:Uncharacterized protein n=1 Tax=Streblomastix strix TaxID=222440 RepID=A0A5J4UNI9_9EUKA|nr:MAG: hypothetical protein EZS28_032434 [Streblomastix strix]
MDLIQEQEETNQLMMGDVQNKLNKIVQQIEGEKDPRTSDIQSSLPPKIIPNRIAREQDFIINDRLADPSTHVGSAVLPPDPDTIVREISHEGSNGAQVAEQIYKEQDGEQIPIQAIPIEDATQERIDEQPNQQQPNKQFNEIVNDMANTTVDTSLQKQYEASQFMKSQMQQGQSRSQMGEKAQEANDEIIKGLKYVVGATGWGKQPINQFFNQQHFPDRKYQWYTNEGQTVLRQAQVKLDKQSLLNMPRKNKNYISQGELSKTLAAMLPLTKLVQGQKQLRKKK